MLSDAQAALLAAAIVTAPLHYELKNRDPAVTQRAQRYLDWLTKEAK